ncbi:MAG TPA: hypothetical protein ENO02_08975, partial [Epsilonproteobacteria bacterium]|nr:hypothetical protein [Campylobacterota bacterium]
NVVIKGLEKKFGSSVDDLKGKSFFDKIIQLPFNLPVAQYDVSKYFKELLHGKFEYREDDIEIFVKLANNSVGFNPRSMKRLFNSLQLLKMVASSKNILGRDSVATAEEKQRILFAILCLQTAYEPMYRFMLKHKSKIDQEFFDLFSDLETLKDSDYYDEVKKDLAINEDDEDKVVRFLEFLNTFYEAIQLDSDQSEDASENLSDKELENLMRFLSFSSITTSNTRGIDASSGTFQFKSIALPFMNETLIPRLINELEAMHSKLEIHSNNNSGKISFVFEQGSMQFEFVVWRNNKEIIVGLDHIEGNKDTVYKWFKKYLSETYPNMVYKKRLKYAYLTLESHKYSEPELSQGEETKMEIYKNIAMRCFENVIPKLSKHYQETEPLIRNVQQFINRLIVQLKKIFPTEEGWVVDAGNVLSLNYHEPINIYQQEWGRDRFAIAIESDKSLFRRIYFGIKGVNGSQKYDKHLHEVLFNAFKSKFGGGESSNWWVYYKYLDQYGDTIDGEPYYEKTGKYLYPETEHENEALKYILTQVAGLKAYNEQLSELANIKV